jgi:hypothetical protein
MIPEMCKMPKMHCRREYQSNYGRYNGVYISIVASVRSISEGNYLYQDPIVRYIDRVMRFFFNIQLEKFISDNLVQYTLQDKLIILKETVCKVFMYDIKTTNSMIENRLRGGIYLE